MKYAVLILSVLVLSASAAVAHDVAYGAKGMASQGTLATACAAARADAGRGLEAILNGAEVASMSVGVCFCKAPGPSWFCTAEAVGYVAHEHPEEMEEMEEQSMGEAESQN